MIEESVFNFVNTGKDIIVVSISDLGGAAGDMSGLDCAFVLRGGSVKLGSFR